MESDSRVSTKLLGAAIKAVPQVKYALGVAGVMAALALGKTFFSSTTEAVVGALAMLVLMFLLLVFAASTKTASTSLRIPALAATWLFLILFVVAATFTVSAAFFSWPLSLSDLSQAIQGTSGSPGATDQPEPVVLTREPKIAPESLPPRMVTPIAENADSRSILRELTRKGSLTLDGSELVVGPPGGNVSLTIAVHTLTLAHGARIVTNGNTLTIQAITLVGGGSIISFRPEDLTPEAAGVGQVGIPGYPGGTLYLDIFKGFNGTLEINLTGQNGGAGGPGAAGSGGPVGPRGSNAVEGLFDCRSGGQDGGPGGQGGSGQAGGDGGNGGNGGDLLFSKSLSGQLSQIHLIATGGSPGYGGLGGPGGPGGPGGEGGSGSARCGGGRGGSQGPPGLKGPDGSKGKPGKDGGESTRR